MKDIANATIICVIVIFFNSLNFGLKKKTKKYIEWVLDWDGSNKNYDDLDNILNESSPWSKFS